MASLGFDTFSNSKRLEDGIDRHPGDLSQVTAELKRRAVSTCIWLQSMRTRTRLSEGCVHNSRPPLPAWGRLWAVTGSWATRVISLPVGKQAGWPRACSGWFTPQAFVERLSDGYECARHTDIHKDEQEQTHERTHGGVCKRVLVHSDTRVGRQARSHARTHTHTLIVTHTHL